MELPQESNGRSAGAGWLQMHCVTLAVPTDCSAAHFPHLSHENRVPCLLMLMAVHLMHPYSHEPRIPMTLPARTKILSQILRPVRGLNTQAIEVSTIIAIVRRRKN